MSTTSKPSKSDKLNKRKLSPNSSNKNTTSTSTKRNKPSILSTDEMDEFRKILESTMANVSKQIMDSQNTLNDKISSLSTDIRNDMKSQIDSLQNSLSTFTSNVNIEIGNMQTELNKQSEQLAVHDDDISRVTLLNQLRISGIPSTPNESLILIFKKIADEIKYNMENPISVPHIRRIITRKNGQLSYTNTIIMYFNGNHWKDSFYSQYLRNAPFNKNFLDSMKCSKIIIGEHLTKNNAAIFSKCLTHRKNSTIAQTYTSNGIVYVKSKKGKTEPAFMIRTENDLQQFLDNINHSSDVSIQNGNNNIEPLNDDHHCSIPTSDEQSSST